ncbi:unnamed protein product [Clavelina lepadiformis]|uniref:Mitochondrial import inner membrane translocase subunit Tim29 n=1 Tax=Clavelina lepadiformis TaxID=159417 RepID=A0ABP0FFU9_CLALP
MLKRLGSSRDKLVKYFKVLGNDYKDSALGTLTEAKEKPFRAFFYTSACILSYTLYKTTPSEAQYNAALVEASNDLLLLSDTERNKTTDNYVQYLLQFSCKGMLRYKHMGFFSLIYHSNHDKDARTYISQCKYTNPRWHHFPKRVMDVGLLGRWWRLSYTMTDYDVDFKVLPKEFNQFHESYVDFVKKVFGYSYFSNLHAQPVKCHGYVFTSPDEVTNGA